jgi:predicted alpha/beta superfamily hydrolase
MVQISLAFTTRVTCANLGKLSNLSELIMKKSHIFKHITAVVVFIAATSTAVAQPAQNVATEYKLQTEILDSKVLNEKRTITVLLPKSYAATPNKTYPVIYRLDGKENLPLMTSVLARLQEANAAPEVIIVAIENTDRMRDLYPTVNQEPMGPVGIGGGAPKFLSFIKSELMPLIEHKYRTHDFKVIAGASAAGVFVLYALQTEPELFQAHIAYSPAVWWDFGETATSTKAFVSKTKNLNSYLYMNIGEESGLMRQRYDDMRSFISSNTPKGFTFIHDEFANVPHALTAVAGIFNAYQNLFLRMQMPLRAYTGDTSSIADYYQRLSKQYGETTPPPESVIRELGYQFVNRGNLDEAIKLFKYGITLYPDKPDAYNGLAFGYEQNKMYQASLEQVNKALALSKEGYDGHEVYLARKTRLLKLLE